MAPTTILKLKKDAAKQGLASFAVAELEGFYRKREITISEMPCLRDSKDCDKFLRGIWELDTMEHFESFYVLYTNRANRIIGWRQISKGGVAGTVADPKIIFQFALLYNACGIVLAHNHPSGNMMASQADINLTKKIVEAGKFLDIEVLDHLIVAEGRYFSFKDEGLL